MRDLRELDKWRVKNQPNDPVGRNAREIADVSGAFAFKLPDNPAAFVVVASNGDGWDHVSVSCRDADGERCPAWLEMDAIKRIFFRSAEVAMQLHVAEADHISVHPYTLHLWRPHGTKRAIPLPPKEFV